MQTISPSQASAEVPINENFQTLEHQQVYGKRQPATSGLTWGYWGGRWGGFLITDGTLALTASSTNYIVVARATGVISVNTATTNWNDATNYLRVYLLTTSASVVTATEDHRAGANGVHGSSGVLLGAVNVFSKNQSVAPSVLTSGANIAVNASLSSNFKLLLGVNATLDNPTLLTDGMVLNIRIKQDATGGRTLAYGTAYKFPGGIVPVLSTAPNAVDLMTCYYDSTDGTLACNLLKGFA